MSDQAQELNLYGLLERAENALTALTAALADLNPQIVDLVRVTWLAGDYADVPLRANVPGVAIFNESGGTIRVGFASGAGAGPGEFAIETKNWLAIPKATAIVSIGAVAAGTAIVATFDRPPALGGGVY